MNVSGLRSCEKSISSHVSPLPAAAAADTAVVVVVVICANVVASFVDVGRYCFLIIRPLCSQAKFGRWNTHILLNVIQLLHPLD